MAFSDTQTQAIAHKDGPAHLFLQDLAPARPTCDHKQDCDAP